jgi:hypothetical protein
MSTNASVKTAVWIILLAVLSATVYAQKAKPATRHPGDVLKVQVKFDGPDAGKIKTVSLYLGYSGETIPADQKGFRTGFSGDNTQATSPNTFQPSITIPNDAATGEYIVYVNATANPGAWQYEGGYQFEFPTIHIENRSTLTPPHITVTEER